MGWESEVGACAKGRLGAHTHLLKLTICKYVCGFCGFFAGLWCVNRGSLLCVVVGS